MASLQYLTCSMQAAPDEAWEAAAANTPYPLAGKAPHTKWSSHVAR